MTRTGLTVRVAAVVIATAMRVLVTGCSPPGDDLAPGGSQVLVVNFWYAACPPCRVEAPWLEELWQQFGADGVQFLGVNVRDGKATAQTFATSFGITYPSLIDTDGSVTLAFTGLASPTAVPTTVVFDRQGRPASRIVGLIDKGVLETLIEAALAEPSDDGGG